MMNLATITPPEVSQWRSMINQEETWERTISNIEKHGVNMRKTVEI